MAMEELLRSLEEEAKRDIASVRSEAEAEVERTRAVARAELARCMEHALAEEERHLRDRAGQDLAQLRREVEGEVLRARREVLEVIYAAVRSRLEEVQDYDAYRAALAERVLAALSYVGDAAAQLTCHPALLGPIERIAGDHPKLRIAADAEMGAGFRIVADGSGLEVDERLEARLGQLLPELDIRLVASIETEGRC